MFDVVFLAAAFFVSVTLPRFLFDGRIEQMTMAVALGLSLSLFSLTIIEALPQSTRLILSNPNWVTTLYLYLLWLLAIEIVIVLPGLCGAAWAESLGIFFCGGSSKSTSSSNKHMDDDKRHLSPFLRRIASWPWWARVVITAIRMVLQFVMICFFRIFNVISSRTTRRRSTTSNTGSATSTALPSRDSTSSLVMTVHDQQYDDIKASLSCSSSSDGPMIKEGGLQSPSSAVSSSTSSRRNYILTLMGSIFGVLTVVIVLRSLGPLVVRSPLPNTRTSEVSDWPSDSQSSSVSLSVVVSWLCAVGLLLSSILNGFGSVSMPYTFLAGLFLKPVRPETITKLSSELQHLQEAVVKKKALLREPTLEATTTPRSSITMSSLSTKQHRSSVKSSSSASGAFGGIGSDLSDELKHRRQFLKTEIEFLEDIIKETTMDIDELRYSQTVATNARTGVGRIKSLIGVAFSVILLVRLFNAGYTIWTSPGFYASKHNHLGSKKSGDVVTTLLLWLTGHHYVSAKQYALLSQMVSLTLAAVLSFSQVRFFLRTVTIVNRRLTRFYQKLSCGRSSSSLSSTVTATRGGSSSISTHIVSTHSQVIAGFLGCYSLACIVLIKMMLPEKFSVAFSTALGVDGIFVVNSHVVNWVFFWSAMVSTAVLGVLLSIQRQNTIRHASSETTTKGFSNKGFALPDV